MYLSENLISILLPYRCLVCHRKLATSYLCFRCTPNELPYSVEPLESSPIRSLRFIWEYDDVSRDFIHVMKYEPSRKLAILAGQFLSTSLTDNVSWDLAIPVPSSKTTLRERGFNQCEIIASKLTIPSASKILVLNGDRPRQAITPIKRRNANMRNAFSVKGNLTAKRILLVDDVVTTGATTTEAAKVLLKAGASTVDVISLVKAHSYV